MKKGNKGRYRRGKRNGKNKLGKYKGGGNFGRKNRSQEYPVVIFVVFMHNS